MEVGRCLCTWGPPGFVLGFRVSPGALNQQVRGGTPALDLLPAEAQRPGAQPCVFNVALKADHEDSAGRCVEAALAGDGLPSHLQGLPRSLGSSSLHLYSRPILTEGAIADFLSI